MSLKNLSFLAKRNLDARRTQHSVATPLALSTHRAAHAASRLPIGLKADRINRSIAKRGIDILGASTGLLFLWPLFLMVAIAIKLDSRGPVFFRQQRYGMGRKPFMILKFRTMSVLESTGEFVQARENDDRTTRVGRYLRRTSLDELPQLINVLLGHMALVGPRPHALAMDDKLARVVPCYADRHLVRPGLTGFAQVDGFRGPTDTRESIYERVRRDRLYIRHWSIWWDIAILVRTPVQLLRGRAF